MSNILLWRYFLETSATEVHVQATLMTVSAQYMKKCQISEEKFTTLASKAMMGEFLPSKICFIPVRIRSMKAYESKSLNKAGHFQEKPKSGIHTRVCLSC